ncbi:MAG: choice-of-anchor Q domain-containing protein, partial [Bacteroidota bacterium]
AVAGLTYSTTLGGTYTTTLTLSQPGGTYSQTVYVKFTPTLAKQYSGSISFNGGGNLTAKTITISGRGVTPVHFVTVAGAGTKDGSSWANAHDGTQIQAAINDSLVTAVWLAAGTYFPTSGTDRTIAFKMKNGVAIYGGFAGTETFFSQRNIATNVTILSGDIGTVGDSTDNSYNVIFNSNIIANRQLVAPAILDGFTIKNGCANNLVLDIKYTQGGAMHIDGLSALNVRNCVFEHNSATMGGALYVAGSQLAAYTMQSIAILPVFTNCIFRYNYFNAIYNQGGGAVYNNYATPIFTNCLFYGNIASQGGAIIEAANSPGSTYNNCTFTANLASKTDYYNGGGAIAIANNGYSNLYNCIVWGNTSLSLSYNKGHQFALSSGGITLNYSCYSYGPGDILTSNGVFTATNNNITSNPMFVNPSTNDYRLYDISPCLDAGNDSYNAETYDIRGIGYSRNLLKTDSNTVGTIDMGAYEFKNGFDPPCVLAISSQSTAAQSQCLNGTYNTISVEATGNGLTYQWYSNASNSNSGGTSLVAANGAQTNSYTPQSATVGTAYYYCVVTNVCGSDTTLISGKFITSAPTAISSQSTAPQTRCFNGTYNAITVTVAGSNVYQWYRNTTADTIAGFAVGTNSYSYTPLADTVGTRYYYCKITVGCGAPITSLVSGAFITNALPVPTISGNTSACINSTGN